MTGRTLTGAWIETFPAFPLWRKLDRRTLTGAWIETDEIREKCMLVAVAPSRVRGLKRYYALAEPDEKRSHPHGCVD